MKNNLSTSAVSNYKLSPEDRKQINDDVTELFSFMKAINHRTDKDPRIRWIVCSQSLETLNKYQEFLANNFSKTFDYEFMIEQIVDSGSQDLSIIIDYFPKNRKAITSIAKYIFETAKSWGCSYSCILLDIIADDDPRRNY